MPARVPDLRRALVRCRVLRAERSRGQSLVEFTLLLPMLLVLLMGMVEFSLAFNATLGINRASQDAALLASEAGSATGSDCKILNVVEDEIMVPNAKANIVEVQIQRTNPSGSSIYVRNTYTRTGSMSCTLADGTTISVPYSASAIGYPEAQRCDIMSGCPTLTPARTQVDTIGVQVKYQHAWVTPLGGLLNFIGGGSGFTGTAWTFQKRNVYRMEPVL